jgi:hypothetical protein
MHSRHDWNGRVVRPTILPGGAMWTAHRWSRVVLNLTQRVRTHKARVMHLKADGWLNATFNLFSADQRRPSRRLELGGALIVLTVRQKNGHAPDGRRKERTTRQPVPNISRSHDAILVNAGREARQERTYNFDLINRASVTKSKNTVLDGVL